MSSLPNQPAAAASGVIRKHGFEPGGVLKRWEDRFGKVPARIIFQDQLPTRDAAMAGDPKLKEVLRCVLSRDGQDIVASNGSDSPLTARWRATNSETLD
jgi:hypothetical protein